MNDKMDAINKAYQILLLFTSYLSIKPLDNPKKHHGFRQKS